MSELDPLRSFPSPRQIVVVPQVAAASKGLAMPVRLPCASLASRICVAIVMPSVDDASAYLK